MTTSEFTRQASALKRRLETVRFCERCGTEIIRSCQECGASLQHGEDEKAPQHCGGCGKPFPWTFPAVPIAEPIVVELSLEETVDGSKESVPARTISAPTGTVKKFVSRVRGLLIKAAPTAQQVGTKVLVDYIEKKTGL
jgi:hypothetical protein